MECSRWMCIEILRRGDPQIPRMWIEKIRVEVLFGGLQAGTWNILLERVCEGVSVNLVDWRCFLMYQRPSFF